MQKILVVFGRKKQRIPNCRLFFQSLPNAHGSRFFCRNRKMRSSCYTEVLYQWSRCWTQGTKTTSSNGRGYSVMFEYCMTFVSVERHDFWELYLPLPAGKRLFPYTHINKKKHNKPIFALANEVPCYASYNVLLVKFKSIPILWTNTTWAFTCPVGVIF